MIKIHSLRVDYEGVTAVKDLDLEILPGQIYGLVGPNGAGKTSTLKAIAGIIEPTYGEILIQNYDLELYPQKALRELGFMPDFPPVYEHLKTWEYLYVFATAYFIPRTKRLAICREWIERVNLQEKWDSYINTLSRGMRQRLVLAKTLLHDPKIVILDEPASGLDPIARMEMRNILKEVATQSKTIIISSHILPELSDFCNAIGVMEKGKLIVSGTLEEIRSLVGMKLEIMITFADLDPEKNKSLLAYLNQHTLVSNISVPELNQVHFNFSGNKHDTAALTRDLIQRDIPVCQLIMKEANMEDIFFKIGAKETA